MLPHSHLGWSYLALRGRGGLGSLAAGAVLPDLGILWYFGRDHLRSVPGLRRWAKFRLRWPYTCAWHSLPCFVLAIAFAAALRRRRWAPFLSSWGLHVLLDAMTHREYGVGLWWPLTMKTARGPLSMRDRGFFAIEQALLLAVIAARLGLTGALGRAIAGGAHRPAARAAGGRGRRWPDAAYVGWSGAGRGAPPRGGGEL